MKVLIVYAHPEPQSFGGGMLRHSVDTLRNAGHEVIVSDLYAMQFNPIASAGDFQDRRFPDQLQYDREQKHAWPKSLLSADIKAEIEKLQWCDTLILQFPLWWFSLPAILKGWIDRCFINGLAYGSGRRMDTGGLKGRRAMLAFTTACLPEMAEADGLLGHMDVTLWHLHSGTLAYAGFSALPPFIGWSASLVDQQQRDAYLDLYAQRLRDIETTEPLFFHPLADFENWRLKPGVEPRGTGQLLSRLPT